MHSTRIVWTGPGAVELEETTAPDPGPGEVLLASDLTLVSPGTEREWLADDRSHAVLGTTYPFVPGYSTVGRVLATGEGVTGWTEGDRVVSNGAPYGAHAAHLAVPATTLIRVPDDLR
jgi:(R,R)-butanediol dehydrogenase/meso-butanediol dehydrogenase/diacetyl reductase